MSFLIAISSPSSTLLSRAPLLLTGGLDSVDKLCSLLHLSDQVLDLYVKDLGKKGFSLLQQALFKRGVREARRKSLE
jgi:hypothetical protein